jgi:putative ABC transport system substrate-binding protein
MAHCSFPASRREFITFLGGAAAAPVMLRPRAAQAQQNGRTRRIAALFGSSQTEVQVTFDALKEGLAKLGWTEDRNLRIEARFGNGDINRIRAYAAELVKLAPDVIIVNPAFPTRVLQGLTRSIPIVFTGVGDPVEGGLVATLARPGGNITGFTNLYSSIGGKWVELLKEIAPHVTKLGVIYNAAFREGNRSPTYTSEIETAASSFSMKGVNLSVRNDIEVERAIVTFAAEPNGALLIVPPANEVFRKAIPELAIKHRLPVIYPSKADVSAGGLMSYGSDIIDRHRRAASYVDRILRGEKPSDLPVQYPTKFELVVNLKAAKAIGLTIPEKFLLRADEVIE